MSKTEAKQIIEQQLLPYRQRPHSDLVKMIGKQPFTLEMTAPSGTRYQIEIEAVWDDKRDGDVRVIGAIDDGGWKAFCPLCSDFIKSSENTFVDE